MREGGFEGMDKCFMQRNKETAILIHHKRSDKFNHSLTAEVLQITPQPGFKEARSGLRSGAE